LAVVGAVAGGAVAVDASGRPLPAIATVVDVHLIASPALPPAARATLIAEAAAIWRHAGVQLRWEPAMPSDRRADAALPVFVVPIDRAPNDDGHEWRVGRLTRDQRNRYVAIASIAAAERAIELVGAGNEPMRRRDLRLGLILGRAVAHEVGHFLLDSGSHSRRGLMRASIPVRDLADLRSGGFAVDPAATEWIRTCSTRNAAAGAEPPSRVACAP
jgi:hypothetical protein